VILSVQKIFNVFTFKKNTDLKMEETLQFRTSLWQQIILLMSLSFFFNELRLFSRIQTVAERRQMGQVFSRICRGLFTNLSDGLANCQGSGCKTGPKLGGRFRCRRDGFGQRTICSRTDRNWCRLHPPVLGGMGQKRGQSFC